MKKFLSKGFSLLTIFSLVFMSNLIVAVAEAPADIQAVCQSQILKSEEGNSMVPLTYEHEAWTASIDDAEWVWSEDGISDPVGEVTETFTRSFTIDGVPADAELEIAADNEYVVTVNDDYFIADTNEDNYSSSGQDTHTIPASALVSGENTIEFEVTNWADPVGTPTSNPAGLMYKLTVNCTSDTGDDDCPPEADNCGGPVEVDETCPIVYARVKFSKVSNGAAVDGWRNWVPGGDLEPQTFVGGSDAGDIYGDEVWFPLTNPDGSFINDAHNLDVHANSDVPGLAVQRLDGSVRLVIYGYHNEENDEFGGKEFASGVIELDGATWTPGMQSPLDWSDANSNPRTHDPLINDPANPMESRGDFTGYINQYDYRFDRMKTWTPEKVAFHLVVTTGSDGFYATYDIDQDCDDGDDGCTLDCNPPIVIPGCMDPQASNYNSEATEDDESCEYSSVIPGCMDPQASNYNSEATEDDGSCEFPETNDFGDDDDDSSSGGGGSRRSSGGGGGEVLGAETQALCAFDIDTYMRFGYKNNSEQVKTLQWLLNKYVDSMPALAVDGDFGPATKAKVDAFQLKYQDKVLSPWNIAAPTGIFFRTTLAWAQNLECPDEPVPIPTDLINWSASAGVVPPKY